MPSGALASQEEEPVSFKTFVEKVLALRDVVIEESPRLPPLFKNRQELAEFHQRHAVNTVAKRDLSTFEGDCFLGIDAGSTTTKLALIDSEGALLYSFYSSNHGHPLQTTVQALRELYAIMPPTATNRNSTVTGYGER